MSAIENYFSVCRQMSTRRNEFWYLSLVSLRISFFVPFVLHIVLHHFPIFFFFFFNYFFTFGTGPSAAVDDELSLLFILPFIISLLLYFPSLAVTFLTFRPFISLPLIFFFNFLQPIYTHHLSCWCCNFWDFSYLWLIDASILFSFLLFLSYYHMFFR